MALRVIICHICHVYQISFSFLSWYLKSYLFFFFFLLFLALEIYGQFSMSDFHFSIWAKTVGSILISIVLGVGGSVVHKRIGAWPSLGKQTLNKHRQPITCDDSI